MKNLLYFFARFFVQLVQLVMCKKIDKNEKQQNKKAERAIACLILFIVENPRFAILFFYYK